MSKVKYFILIACLFCMRGYSSETALCTTLIENIDSLRVLFNEMVDTNRQPKHIIHDSTGPLGAYITIINPKINQSNCSKIIWEDFFRSFINIITDDDKYNDNYHIFINENAYIRMLSAALDADAERVARGALTVLSNNVGNKKLKEYSNDIKKHFALSQYFDLSDSLELLPLLSLTEKEKEDLRRRATHEQKSTFQWDSTKVDSLIRRFEISNEFGGKKVLARQLGRIGTPQAATALLNALNSNVSDTSGNRIVSIRLPIIEALGFIDPTNELFNSKISMIKVNGDWGYVHIVEKPHLDYSSKEQYGITLKKKMKFESDAVQTFSAVTSEAIRHYLDSIIVWGNTCYKIKLPNVNYKPFIIVAKEPSRGIVSEVRQATANGTGSRPAVINEKWNLWQPNQKSPNTLIFERYNNSKSLRVLTDWHICDSVLNYSIRPMNGSITVSDTAVMIKSKTMIIKNNVNNTDFQIDGMFSIDGVFKGGTANGSWAIEYNKSSNEGLKNLKGKFHGTLFPGERICITKK